MKNCIYLLTMCLVGTCVTTNTATAQTDSEIKAGHDNIEKSAKQILNLAYPTNKRLDSTDYRKGTKYTDGTYSLEYRLKYTDSDGDPAHVTFRFYFKGSGKMTSISELDRSSFWESFTTANIVIGAIKESIRNDRETRDTVIGKALLEITDAKEFTLTLANIRSGK